MWVILQQKDVDQSLTGRCGTHKKDVADCINADMNASSTSLGTLTKLALRVSHVSDCMTYDLVTSITVITQLGMFIAIYVTKLANSLQLHSLVKNKQGLSCKPISLSIMGYGSLYNYIIHAALVATMHISLLAISFGSIQKCTNVQSIYMWCF